MPDTDAAGARDALAERLVEATIGAFDLVAVALGDRLGLYRALAEGGPTTSGELAARAGIAERYAREWLEQQAVTGILHADDQSGATRRFSLPAGHAEALLDQHSLAYVAPLAEFAVGSAARTGDLVDAYRSGAGVPWPAYGAEVITAQERVNRPQFEHRLASEWLPALGALHDRLRRDGGAVLDVGCGTGWSSLGIGRAYPRARVVGVDVDETSIARATGHARDAGMGERVTFQLADGAEAPAGGPFLLATMFEALHDMARPVEVLRQVRRQLAPDGALLIADERVADTFVAPGEAVDRLMYGYSITVCLPTSLADPPSDGLGTVLRPSTVARLATDAGFGASTVLPVDHEAFRFYRLDP